MQEHMAAPFPDSVEKGMDYGDVEPVLIDADIYGWALNVAEGSRLDVVHRQRLRSARDDLVRSLSLLPEDAHGYYRRLVEMAAEALAVDQRQER